MHRTYYIYNVYCHKCLLGKYYNDNEKILKKENMFINYGYLYHYNSAVIYNRYQAICYEENGQYYDLITREILTPMTEDNQELQENKIYFEKEGLRKVEEHEVFNYLSFLSKNDLKTYKKILLNKYKTKNDTFYKSFISQSEKKKIKMLKRLDRI